MSKVRDFDHLKIVPGKKVRLDRMDPDSSRKVPERERADAQMQEAAEEIGRYQDRLYAEGRQSLLVVLQGMDGSGKDGTVRRVFDAVNPTGVQVTSFKVPNSEELRHDFLWRCHAKVPPRGYIGVFNRSYYEDVLVVRVHAEHLLPPELRNEKGEWERRFAMINSFEALLSDTGTRILKFFLHISKEEQRERFKARQKDPEKHWKLAAGDFVERGFWDAYQVAYEKMLAGTSTENAPWYVVPANHKWVRNHIIARIVAGALREMKPRMPEIGDMSLIKRRFS